MNRNRSSGQDYPTAGFSNWTSNTYDNLNRVTGITYSDSTPAVTFGYDSLSVSNGKGRRTSMVDVVGTTTYTV